LVFMSIVLFCRFVWALIVEFGVVLAAALEN